MTHLARASRLLLCLALVLPGAGAVSGVAQAAGPTPYTECAEAQADGAVVTSEKGEPVWCARSNGTTFRWLPVPEDRTHADPRGPVQYDGCTTAEADRTRHRSTKGVVVWCSRLSDERFSWSEVPPSPDADPRGPVYFHHCAQDSADRTQLRSTTGRLVWCGRASETQFRWRDVPARPERADPQGPLYTSRCTEEQARSRVVGHSPDARALRCRLVSGSHRWMSARLKVLVLGDSYSAGNGGGSYYYKGCYRSYNNYGWSYAKGLTGAPYDATLPEVFVGACSGAVTRHYWEPQPRGDLRERPQSRYVTGEEDVVLLTFGGNDVGFEKIVTQCLAFATRKLTKCVPLLQDANRKLRNGEVSSALTRILVDLRRRVPKRSRIVVLGYPYLENQATYELDGYPVGQYVRDLGRTGDTVQQSAVDVANADSTVNADPVNGARVQFVETKSVFAGREPRAASCNPSRWILQPPYVVSRGDLRYCEPHYDRTVEKLTYYHPRPEGWKAEGRLLLRILGDPLARV